MRVPRGKVGVPTVRGYMDDGGGGVVLTRVLLLLLPPPSFMSAVVGLMMLTSTVSGQAGNERQLVGD